MKKKLIQSTIILIVISVIAKALSFGIRIFLARKLNEDAMSIYSLASPTLVFIITLAQMGIPSALSKVIAQNKQHHAALFSSILLSLLNNIIVMGLFSLLIPLLSTLILKQDAVRPVLKAMIPMIPMVTLSGLLKGYLQGRQQHIAATTSQIFEEIFRFLYLIIAFNTTITSPIQLAEIAMFSIFIGECASSCYMFLFCMIKNDIKISSRNPFDYLHKSAFDEILSLSIPMTSSRLIGSLTYFLEPILLVLNVKNVDAAIHAYGQLNGYVLPIITMPSFITVTLASTLLPAFTYEISRNNHLRAYKIFQVIFTTCLLIGLISSSIAFFFTNECLNLFYHNTSGAAYLKALAWPFAFYALQPVLSSMLHALNQSKKALLDTTLGSISRLLIVTFLTPVLNETALPVALMVSMLITTSLHAFNVSVALWRLNRSA